MCPFVSLVYIFERNFLIYAHLYIFLYPISLSILLPNHCSRVCTPTTTISYRISTRSPLARAYHLSHLLDLIEFFPEEEMFPPNESVEILHSDKDDPIFRLIKESLSLSLSLFLAFAVPFCSCRLMLPSPRPPSAFSARFLLLLQLCLKRYFIKCTRSVLTCVQTYIRK